MKKIKGFTLIELLVVIAIIGLLATLSVIALSNARAKSRDSKRLADVKQMQTSLEMYYTQIGHYPSAGEFDTGSISIHSDNIGTTTYMHIIPNAPTPNDGLCSASGNGYVYRPSDDGLTYTISFCIGGQSNSLSAGPKCATPGGILNVDCGGNGGGGGNGGFACGGPVAVPAIAGHACNTGAPDYDTCTYDTVQIGSQCWLKQNLNIGTIINGSSNQTNNSTLEKYCYSNTYGNCQSDGALYQWDEVMQYSTTEGAQGICPDDWHIPTDAEQNILDQYLNNTTCDANRLAHPGCADAGTKLQVGGSSGFDGRFAGARDPDGTFRDGTIDAYFWSSSMTDMYSWERYLDTTDSTVVYRSFNYRTDGLSVRCLKD